MTCLWQPISYPWRMRGVRCVTVAYMLRCRGISFLRVTYLLHFYLASLWYLSSLYMIHSKPRRSHCVSSYQAAISLCTCCVTFDRATYLLRSHGVCMTFVWWIEAATNVRRFVFKPALKKKRHTLANEAIVERISYGSFQCCGVAVAFLAIPNSPYVRKPIRKSCVRPERAV